MFEDYSECQVVISWAIASFGISQLKIVSECKRYKIYYCSLFNHCIVKQNN